jgi:hypothetical protein
VTGLAVEVEYLFPGLGAFRRGLIQSPENQTAAAIAKPHYADEAKEVDDQDCLGFHPAGEYHNPPEGKDKKKEACQI